MNKTRQDFPLSIRKPIKKTMVKAGIGVLTGLLLIGIHLFLAPYFNMSVAAAIKMGFRYFTDTMFNSFIIMLLVGAAIYEYLYYESYYYDLGDDIITIRKGVMSTQEITLAYERIQDINVDQDFLDRLFGLYDVHFTTATMSSEKEAHIDGVEKETAESLKQLVLGIVKEKLRR